METKYKGKSCNEYICDICDYITSRKSSIDKHLLSAKHKKSCNGNIWKQKSEEKLHQNNTNEPILTPNCMNNCNKNNTKIAQFSCSICNKIYTNRAGLWKHQKKCEINMNESDGITTQMFYDMLKQNIEFTLKKDRFLHCLKPKQPFESHVKKSANSPTAVVK